MDASDSLMKAAFSIVAMIALTATTLASAALGAEAEPGAGLDMARFGSEGGFGLFQQKCTSCHGNANTPDAPSPASLRSMSPERIYQALTTGVMQVQGQALSDLAKRRVAESLAGRLLGTAESGAARNMPNQCAKRPPMADPSAGPSWNGWGNNIHNTRLQSSKAAGLDPASVQKLKLKWAFGYPDGVSAFGQPSVVSGRVFVGTDTGFVYSLDAETGCIYWSYKTVSNVRNAIVIAPIEGYYGTKYAAFFGDLQSHLYAVDAETGALLWRSRVEEHFTDRITAAPTYHDGVLYVPVSSWEEFSAAVLDYPCCTSQGSVVAVNANTGDTIWKTYVMNERPQPVRKNSKGVQQYAPAGGSVWNSPTVDVKRGLVYFGTGDATTYPAPDTSDAIMAVDMKTGAVRWTYQVHQNDSALGGCFGPNKSDNCPKVLGPDWDIPCSPMLTTLADGRDVIIVGTKPGDVLALDPDKDGAVIWRVNIAQKSERGIQWGGAIDGDFAYFGLTGGGMVKVHLTDGEKVWYAPIDSKAESLNNGAPTSAIPGVAFIGGSDGQISALSMDDGKVIWSYDSAHDFQTVNKIKAKGGAINTVGPAIVGGMLFVGSGYDVVMGTPGNVLLAFSAD
jgi:polyvinyl alcohol dehydrogenase (cytochrome)